MKHKKIIAILAMCVVSACAVAFLLLGARADRERDLAQLPLPDLSACNSSAHPRLPERFRALYLMAPFTTGQLVIGEIVHDGPLSATRFTLYGVERGVADFLVTGDGTYLLPSVATEAKNCTSLGDTGWRPLPADWLTDASRCTGSAPILKTPANWWKTPIEPAPSSYWIWSKHSDGTPLRLVFSYPNDRFLALSRFAFSNQLVFESLEHTDLGDIASSCRTAIGTNSVASATELDEVIDAMARSPVRADAAIARLVPALQHRCTAPAEPLWTTRLALTGLLTPFDSDENPMPMEVLYDWSVPGQRSRVFPGADDVAAHDFLMLRSGGYNVTYGSDGKTTCIPGLPGTLRPDWAQRAPCECRAQISAGISLTPDEPIKILSCPLHPPRIAWAWYTHLGRPTVFMVTSKRGDEDIGDFAVLDYHQWSPNLAVDSSAFTKPSECPDSPADPAGMPISCTACHSSGANH